MRQVEMCPTTGRAHLQFFVSFPQRLRLSGVKKLFPGDHLEPARDPVKAREYCMKVETRVSGPWETGTWVVPGAGITSVLESVRGKRVLDVIEEDPKLWRNLRVLSELRSALAAPRSTLTQGLLFTGLTGSGKTKIASIIASFVGTSETYWHNGTKWWPGYDQQELVVYDEYRGQLAPSELLRLLDRQPYQVESKGGFAQFNSNFVIFTSNLELEDMYRGVDARTLAAFRRRLTIIRV